MRSKIGIVLLPLIVLSGCDTALLGGPRIVGSGVTREETREVPPFHSMEITSAFVADVTVGEKQSVKLSMDDNLLSLVKTEVKDGLLTVRYAPNSNVSTRSPQKITIVVPSLDRIVASGAAQVHATVGEAKAIKLESEGAATVDVKGLASDTVDVLVSGAGQVKLAGQAKRLTLEVAGAAKLVAPDVVFESAKVELSGASHGEIQVTGSVEGDVSGASSLTVKGMPVTRSVKTSGASRVTY